MKNKYYYKGQLVRTSDNLYEYAVVWHLDEEGVKENIEWAKELNEKYGSKYNTNPDTIKRECVASCHTTKALAEKALHRKIMNCKNPHWTYSVEKLEVRA